MQDTKENVWKFFIDRVRRQLKVILCQSLNAFGYFENSYHKINVFIFNMTTHVFFVKFLFIISKF